MNRALRRRVADKALTELRRRHLIDFAQGVDPRAAACYGAPHLRRIAEKLEAFERRDFTRLFITTPPRHWKSSLIAEKFVAWYLGRHPTQSVGLASHTSSLSERFSRSVRDLIAANTTFSETFPGVAIRPDQSGVSDWLLAGGFRSSCRAIGTGGALIGSGFDLLVIDDPVADHEAAFSKRQRDATWAWYQNVLRERLDPGGLIVLVMSRWHEDDLAGRLLKAAEDGTGEKWEQLHLPAVDENGNALWPERWPVAELDKIKLAIGSRAWAAKFQGRPKPDAGNILDSRKLVMIDADAVPPLIAQARYWDLAFSERDGADFVAGAKLGRDANGRIYILHVRRVKGRWPESKPIIVDIASGDGPSVNVGIEANGTQLGYAQDAKADSRMSDRYVQAVKPIGSKEMRASLWGSRLDDGLIYCVRAPWNNELFEEMDSFPFGAHDDQVDGISGAYSMLNAPTIAFA